MLNRVVISGVDTSKLPILSNDEKNELLKRIKAGDKKAKDQFVEGNLRLVLSIVQRFAGRDECMDDLFQVGCIGLIKSIDNFDLSLGLRFSTYGVPMILGEIRRYLRDNNMVRVSRATRDLAYRALSVKERLAHQMNREPTVSEIAKEMGERKEDVVMALDAIVDPISLFEPVYSDGNDAIFVMDQISDDRGGDDWIDELLIKDAINKLPEREKNIIELRFLEGKTQMEVAQEVGISQAQVSRLEKGAIDRIKSQL
ncbi:MAG: RNA polymerase sporulation sigma factor SigG [Clostridia bacterium]|nr:RNA polymerase sporulation sigma factor SigG [Clostridia bacterium]